MLCQAGNAEATCPAKLGLRIEMGEKDLIHEFRLYV